MKFTFFKNISVAVFFLVSSLSLLAQAPQRMSYQSIIRNAAGELIASATIGVKVSIIKDTETGTVVYEETFTGSSNENGLLTLEIGGGIPVTGTFAAINWSTGIYYVKTETDPTGGTNYTITGIGQLLSVPYAFYAAKSTNQGKTSIILTGDITDAEAAEQVALELGYNTENIIVEGTTQLTSVDFTGATNLLSISITENAVLTQVNFSTLTKVFNEVYFIDNLALTNITFPVLTKVNGRDLFINGNPSLTSVSFPLLEKMDKATFTLNDNVALTQIDLPVAKKMYELNLNGNTALTTFNAPQVLAIPNNIYIDTNPNISTFNLSALQTAGNVVISGTSITALSFPQLTSVSSSFAVLSNVQLQSVSLPLINNTGVTIGASPQLTAVNLEGYTSGTLSINDTGLSSISLPNYTNPQNIYFIGNPVLTSVSLTGIQTVGQNIMIVNNASLNTVTFPEGIGFSIDALQHEIQLINNALTSTCVNDVLHKMVTAIPVSYKMILLNGQTPSAPPTGQGLIDKQTLIDNSNTVNTD